MAKKINLGKVGITTEGAYDSSKAYEKLSCVTYNHESWVSTKDVPAGNVPADGSAYWQKMSERGEQGIQGPVGPQGNSAFDGNGVEIVNNLTQGGEAAVLSAEQGKILKTEVTELSDEVTDIADATTDTEQSYVSYPLTMYTEGGVNGYRLTTYGQFQADNSRRTSNLIDVVPGDKFKVSTHLGTTLIAAAIGYDENGSYAHEYWKLGTGTQEDIVDELFTVPAGVYKVAFQSANTTEPTVKKQVNTVVSKSYTKTEADNKFAEDGSVVKHTAQTLSDSEKEQARTNIDAVSNTELSQLSGEVTTIDNAVMTDEASTVQVPVTIQNGYYNNNAYANFISENLRRSTEPIDVTPGEKYYVTTHIGTSGIIAWLMQWNGTTVVGNSPDFVSGMGNVTDKVYIVPDGVNKIAIGSNDTTAPSLKKAVTVRVSNVYTKAEAEDKFAPKTAFANKVYGVKWDTADPDDLGERCFDAVGMTAQIGIGTTDGHSDFDNILPWSGMKRCNIKTNANGAKIVTFEGETGFALDGSNGDVFVRIPKFYSERYIKDGYEYIEVSAQGSIPHPAFIEDGKELNEIFVAAFEGKIVSNKLCSIADVIPSNNETGSTFLTAATANGANYTLYDLRAVDALWRLMAVEYGCRNSNQILGWGCADFQQPIDHAAYRVSVDAINTNTVTLGLPIDNEERLKSLSRFSPGNTLTICDGSQFNIVAQRVITAVSQASMSDNLVISFDGDGIDVSVGMFAGSAPCVTNRCETIDVSVRLSWHTGRADYAPLTSSINKATINPCRYRWIENIVGSAWHFLPDVTFNGLQMYVCQNMKDYEMFKITPPYMPVGATLTKNTDNGNKADVTNANYWITKLMNDIFAPAVNFGVSYDKSLTSTKAFGAYYYLYGTKVCIVNGGGFDHLWRCNILTNRAWVGSSYKWYLYGARLMFKNI